MNSQLIKSAQIFKGTADYSHYFVQTAFRLKVSGHLHESHQKMYTLLINQSPWTYVFSSLEKEDPMK